MPLYVYRCPRCQHVEEVQRKIAERDEPLDCPTCATAEVGAPMIRQPTAPQGNFPGAATWRGGA